MRLPFADPTSAREQVEHRLMNTRVEGSELQPGFHVSEDVIVWNANEVLQQRGVASAEAASLRDQPAIEGRAAIHLQAFQKLSGEQRSERSQSLRGDRLNPLLSRLTDLGGIDEAVRQIETDRIGLSIDPAPARDVENLPGLAEAPSQFTAGIVRNVPQQFAKMAAADSPRGEQQIANERPHLS